jgi:glycosyltransferase involved in cell wall biosynthesis
MKILAVATFCFPDHFGGAERVLYDVCQRLAARDHEVTLLTGRVGGATAEETRDGVKVVRYPVEQGSPLRFYRSVWRGVRGALARGVGADADVLSTHQVLSAAAALAPGGSRCRARVASFYAPYHLEYLARWREGREGGAVPLVPRAIGAVLRRADRYVLTHSQQVLVLSRYSLDQVRVLHPKSVERTTIAPAGVDLERFRPATDGAERAAALAHCELPDDGVPLLLSVRRLVPRMGLGDLLEATARLLGEGTPVRLAIAGDGPERPRLAARAEELGIADHVHLLGRVPDERLPDLYRAADAFALPTRSLEGFGMVTAEALASGLPVVATDAGASGEVLADVDEARLVPPGDPEAMADALSPLLRDADVRRAAADQARAHAEHRLHWDRHLDAFEEAAARAVREAP